jgi:hypothetical protein
MSHRSGYIDVMSENTPTPDHRPGDGGANGTPRHAGDDAASGAPFGLPVLAELPELARVLDGLVSVDRQLAEVLDILVLLQEDGTVESTTGVPMDQWLSIVARRTRGDVRMLRAAVRACRRLPSLHRGFGEGRISWAQLRTLAIQTEKASTVDDLALDAAVADAIFTCEDAHPDALAQMVGWAIESLRPPPDPAEEPKTEPEGFVALQPRLDGSGGRVFGELDALSFAILDSRTAPAKPPKVPPTRDGFGGATDPEAAAEAARVSGRERLANLISLLTHDCGDAAASQADAAPTELTDDVVVTGAASDVPIFAGDDIVEGQQTAGRRMPIDKLLLRAELDSLAGSSGLPSQLLTSLAGGVMHVDAATARRIAEHAPTLRLIITDRGRVVGVGRQTKAPPDWLRDATLAVHDTCTAPGCLRPALTAHTDHAIPWDDGGHTDLANCAPLCGHDNLSKERDGWTATGEADGTRRWHHPRTGLSVTTYPATRRPSARPTAEPSNRRCGGPPPRRQDDRIATTERAGQPPWPPPPDEPDG